MLHSPSYHLLEAATALAIRPGTLSDEEAANLRRHILRQYVNRSSDRMWEGIADARSRYDPTGWSQIDDYLNGRPFLVLFDIIEDNRVLEFPGGTRITPILEECPGFEFYVTDRQASYLICFNHHDFLIATGAAKDWNEGNSCT
jgi:hypothetical protein